MNHLLKKIALGSFLIIGFFSISKLVFAETIEGKVYSVNAQEGTLQVSPRVGEPKINLQMDSKASLKGINSLSELEVGDVIRADVEENNAGEKTVRSLELKPFVGNTVKANSPAVSAPAAVHEKYTWGDKLSRGIVNFFTSPVELPRTIDQVQAQGAGPGEAWTSGLVRGIGRTFLRAGAGLVEVVTFPFDFPAKGKTPLMSPEFAWQKWPLK